jgi:LuxR family quorum sensing-dependent transcriptional regulator
MSQKFLTNLAEISSAVEHCRSLDEVEGTIASTAAQYGLFLYLLDDTKRKTVAAPLPESRLFCNWPSDWRSRYIERKYVHQDPIARRATTTCEPFVWHDAILEGQNEQEADFMDEAASFGLGSGICIPICVAGRYVAGATLSGGDLDLSLPVVQKIRALILLARDKFSRLTYSLSTMPLRRLSDRERQVLTWSALGKSAWEISSIIGISEVTAHKHVSSAMRKLNAVNKTHAVVTALLAEEIVL